LNAGKEDAILVSAARGEKNPYVLLPKTGPEKAKRPAWVEKAKGEKKGLTGLFSKSRHLFPSSGKNRNKWKKK